MESAFKRIQKKEKEYNEVYEYLERYDCVDNSDVDVFMNKDVKINKTIWILWLQGIENAPALIKKCVESIKKNAPTECDVINLNENNISEYVKFSDSINNKRNQKMISATHFSDILRIELLYIYGGCWIDATVFCSESIPKYMINSKLFFPKWSMLGESVLKNSSWWICAEKNNELIGHTRDYLRMYWDNETELKNYYLLHIIMSRVVDEYSSCQADYRNMPYLCNANPHVLYSRFANEYSPIEWNIIKCNSLIHKLSYKKHFLLGDIDNFYTAFMEGRLK